MPGSSRRRGEPVLFATSNGGKLEEARRILLPFGLSVQRHDGKGVEIQADTTGEVAIHASRAAAMTAGRPVLVEDAGLYVESLRGFPGPYSAHAFKTIGVAGMIALLRPPIRRRADRAALFVSSVSYCEPGGEPHLFEGSVRGAIAMSPRGSKGFGFDPIFVPKALAKTFGEMTLEEKCAVSHRAVAMRKFAKWYLSRGEHQSGNGFKPG
jgi:XTP/dITP diphosphohydrolase